MPRFINQEKLFRAIQFLKDSGNSFYQSFNNLSDFKRRWETEDLIGYEFPFGKEGEFSSLLINPRQCSLCFIDDNQNWEEIMKLRNYFKLIKQEVEEKEEIEYRENDSIWLWPGNLSLKNFPEAFHTENAEDMVENV